MDAPFDRGEVDRASLDATERLRARLSGRPPAAEARPRRTIFPWVVVGALFVFSAGMIANPWFESSVRGRLPFAQTPAPAETAEVAALRQRIARMETRADPAAPMPTAPMSAERLARTEARIETSTDQIAREADRIDRLTGAVAALGARLDADRDRSDAATAAATAAADRAEAMLILVLARGAVETGRPFGGLDPALRRSFGVRYPDAVKAIAALGSDPVTPATLRRDFNALRPTIGAPPAIPPRQSWWDTLAGTVTAAISRPADAPKTAVDAATAALARGDTSAAALQLRQLPAPRAPAVNAWLAAYDRLVAGNRALAALETAALMPPPAPAS